MSSRPGPGEPGDHGRGQRPLPGPHRSRAEDDPALTGDADAIAAGLAAHAADGADHVIAALDPNTPEALARFLEAVERYRASEPGGSPS